MGHIEFFGDSYQYCHRLLMETILPAGEEWTVHPMMFRTLCKCNRAPGRCPPVPGGGLGVERYAGFLGLEPRQVLTGQDRMPLPQGNLEADVNGGYEYLFLDPDTGINVTDGPNNPTHVRGVDLAAIARQEGRRLVLVFNQSYTRANLMLHEVVGRELDFLCRICVGPDGGPILCPRCKTVVNLRRKLADLCHGFNGEGREAIHCGAVIVHAGSLVSYVWVSTNAFFVRGVLGRLREELRIFDWRLVACPCDGCSEDLDYFDLE